MILDVATPVIEKNVTKSLEDAVLTRSSSQPQGVEMKEAKIKTPLLDQTDGRKEENQVKMLSQLEIQNLRKRSLQVPLKTPPNLNISLPVSLSMQRIQVILLKIQASNKIKSSSRETMMNNLMTRRLPKLTGSRNPSDLQLLILIRDRRKRLTLVDELHKFSDGTLNDVQSALRDIDVGIRMEFLPMRKWSNLNKKRARVMVQDIDKQLYQKRLMRNLEKFVGGRIYGHDLRLLERKI
uniref:Uncharacterized protein n=1 Tax=Tanacetum cinerariifolium TaxID=118510 RepID=A0A6L2KTI4_TANCI|nr:hypothetical protein [Tanacetum cinerariifolium]